MRLLVEELALLALEDGGKLSPRSGRTAFRKALIGACLIELNERGWLDVELDGVRLLSRDKTGCAPLDWVLSHLDWDVLLDCQQWVLRHTDGASALLDITLQRLVAQRVLGVSDSRVLWIFKQRAFSILEPQALTDAKLRIHSALLGDALPTPHASALIGLADMAGLLEGFMSSAEIARLQSRRKAVGGLDLIARSLESAMLDENVSAHLSGPDIPAFDAASQGPGAALAMGADRAGLSPIARPVGRLDYEAAAAFQQELVALVDAAGQTKQALVLNLSGLSFVSSAGLRAFLVAARAAQAAGVALILCELPDAVRAVFDLAGFSQLLRIVPLESDALLAASAP